MDLYAYVGGDPINRNDPTGMVDIFIGGGGDTVTGIMRDYAGQWQKAHPDRQVLYYNRGDGDIVRETINSYATSDEPVNVIGHSWGAATAGDAADDSYGHVTNLITLDPVSRLEGMSGKKPDNVQNWLNVTANPSTPNRDDKIAAIGGKPSSLPTDKADTNVTVNRNHGDAAGMMRDSGAAKVIDDSYAKKDRRDR